MDNGLKASFGSWHVWSLAIGLGSMGEYFGWSYVWDKTGTVGFLGATFFCFPRGWLFFSLGRANK